MSLPAFRKVQNRNHPTGFHAEILVTVLQYRNGFPHRCQGRHSRSFYLTVHPQSVWVGGSMGALLSSDGSPFVRFASIP
jgi:hypothetical protein